MTGVSGLTYNLIADEGLYINAKFGTAYTTGLFLNPDTQALQKFRPRGTWMNCIGIVFSEYTKAEETSVGNSDAESGITSDYASLVVSTTDSSFMELCELKPRDCLSGGSVWVNGVENAHVGTMRLSGTSMLMMKNYKSYARVSIDSDRISAQIDVVPPPAEWQVAGEDNPQFTHLNLKLQHIALTPQANGLMGCSVRLKYGPDGAPVMEAFDKDGLGVLDGPPSLYAVADITEHNFPFYSSDWANKISSSNGEDEASI